jgi:putative addiction module component (TIGR02574 family)
MSATVESVLSLAMSLSATEQRELAERLWETTGATIDGHLDEETWNEIGRRVAASDKGEAVHLPGEAVLSSM